MSGSRVINVILEREGVKAGTFAKIIGITPTQVYDIQKGKIQNISPKIANKIIESYPNYTYSWLVSGEGSMLVEDSLVPESSQVDEVKTTREELLKVIAELSEANNKLSAANERYSRIIDRLLEEKEAMSV